MDGEEECAQLEVKEELHQYSKPVNLKYVYVPNVNSLCTTQKLVATRSFTSDHLER